MVSCLVHVHVYSAVTCRHFRELRCLLHHHVTLILCKCSCSNWVCMLYFHNHFHSMYEFCCMFMLLFSSPYVRTWIKHIVHMFWQTIWQLSASTHVTLLCLCTCMAKAVLSTVVVLTCITLCSHICISNATDLQSFSLCVYSSSCRPIGYSASRSDRNCRRCYHHCRYFWYHLGVGVHMDRQKFVHKMQHVQLLYILAHTRVHIRTHTQTQWHTHRHICIHTLMTHTLPSYVYTFACALYSNISSCLVHYWHGQDLYSSCDSACFCGIWCVWLLNMYIRPDLVLPI